ncbi:MAG: cbb3-type cytochrome c oxidase subunit 3 [Pseudomonadota bacterium]
MYETLSQFAQTWGLLLFVLAFLLVLIYALSPRNKKQFDDASRIPFEEDEFSHDKRSDRS